MDLTKGRRNEVTMSSVNRGEYPTKPTLFATRGERLAFGGMVLYIVVTLFCILFYYTYGGV